MCFVDIRRDDLRAASPDGKIMKLGAAAFEMPRVYCGPFPTSTREQDGILDHTQDMFFHLEDHFFTVAPCTNRRFTEVFDLSSIVTVLKNFEGWSVCWKPRYPVDWLPEVREVIDSAYRQTPKPRHTIANERRASLEIIALFDEDDQVTKSTCKARLDVALGTLAFGRAWEMAKLKRPALGAGGRPKSKPQTETPI